MWTASLCAKQEVAELQDDIASPARFRSRHYSNKENGSKHRLPHAGLDAALATWFILRIPHAEHYEDCIYLILAYDLLSSWGRQLQDNRIFGRVQRRLIHCLSQHLECHLASVLTKELPRPTSEHQFHPATKTFGHRNLNTCHVRISNHVHAALAQGRSAAAMPAETEIIPGRGAVSFSWRRLLWSWSRCHASGDGIVQHDAEPLHEASSFKLLLACRMLHMSLTTKEDRGLHLPLHEEMQRHPERGCASLSSRVPGHCSFKPGPGFADNKKCLPPLRCLAEGSNGCSLECKAHGMTCSRLSIPKVWMGLVSTKDKAFMTALQRLSNVVPSTATHAEKMHVAGLVADSLTETLAADPKKQQQKPKAPLCLQ